MTKWICNECTICMGGACKCETHTFAPEFCVINKKKQAYWVVDNTDLNTATIESVETETELPKLTAEVFDRPDCPKWAKYAAVDKKGYVFVFDLEPECTHSSWYKRTRFGNRYELCNGYDSSDYEHSLVRISEQKQESVTDCNQLPDWCKVGEWVYSIPAEKYDKIIAIQDFRIVTREMKYTDDYINDGNVAQARLRPYNAEEMKSLVGKVLEHDGNASLVIVYLGNGLLRVGTKWVSAERLIEDGYTIDGKPCGKFEHLEDGGWVE